MVPEVADYVAEYCHVAGVVAADAGMELVDGSAAVDTGTRGCSLLLMLIPVWWGLTLAVVFTVIVVVTSVRLEMVIRLEGLFHHVHDGGVNVRLRSLC